MTRARGVNWQRLHTSGSIEADSANWYPMNDLSSATLARGGFDTSLRASATWTGSHTQSPALCALEYPPGHDHTDTGIRDDRVFSQYVTGASYLTFTPASASYNSQRPWMWCFVQPDSDVGDAFIMGRDGILRVEFVGTDVVATATLTDASTVAATASYGTITDAHMVAVSFTASDLKVRIYIDGVPAGISAAGSTGIVQSTSAPYRYGGGPSETNFRGHLDMWAHHFGTANMNDDLALRMWLQLKGWVFPYLDTFGQYADGVMPDQFAGSGASTPSTEDGYLVVGPRAGGNDAGAGFNYRSMDVYYETAVWGGATLLAGLGYDASAVGSVSNYAIRADNANSQVIFTSGGSDDTVLSYADLGVDAPTTRSKQLRLGLRITDFHGAGDDNLRPEATAYANGTLVGNDLRASNTDFWFPALLRNSGASDAFFEYFYMNHSPATPDPDFHEPVVGAVGIN